MKKLLFVCASLLLLFTLPVIRVDASGASQDEASVTVNVETVFGNDDSVTTGVAATYGTSVAFDASLSSDPNYVFAFWIVDGVVDRTLPVDHPFLVRNDLDLTAIFKPTGTYAVLYMDANGQILYKSFVDATGTADAVDPIASALITAPTKPGYTVAEIRWDGSLNDIAADTVLILQYDLSTAETAAITVNNGTGGGSFALNAPVTIVANDDVASTSYFQYWVKDGQFWSNQRTYTFTAVEDETYTAVFAPYAAAADFAYVVLSLADLGLRAGYDSYVGQYHVPTGYTVVEFGILASTSAEILDLGTVLAANKYEASKSNGTTQEFLMSFNETHAYTNLRAYLVCKDTLGAIKTFYSVGYELLISEYGEGSGNNKWIEIYNPTSAAVDLGNYKVYLNSNGGYGSTPLSFASGTMLAAKDVYVITNSGATLTQVTSNSDVTSTVTYFNGDDAVQLVRDGVVIDHFGVSGMDPGVSWIPTAGYDTLDKTWTRSWGNSFPSSVWYYQQWTVSAIDTETYVGYHENATPTAVTISGDTTVMAGNTISLSVTYAPIDARRGVTWTSGAEGVATVSASGVVTGVSAGEATITATSTVTGSVLDTHVVTVTARPTYTITASSNNESMGTVSPTSSTVSLGSDCTITITANSGYYVDSITLDGTPVAVSQTSYTISSVSADHTVVVTFAASASYSISVSSANEAYGTVSASPTTVSGGGSTTLTLSPTAGYKSYSLSINGGSAIYILGQTSYLISNISEDMTIVVTFKEEVQSGTTIGFESSEGFTAGTVYNNTTINYQGSTGAQWGFYYGTPSTTSPIIGLQSAQMRWYTTAPSALGYTFTNFTTTDVSKVVFTASYYSTYALNVKVSYSTDGVTWTDAQTVTLTNTATEYTVNINAQGDVKIRFMIALPASNPSSTARLYLDGVKIFKLQ